ncbi:MAG: NnrS family protein [gamma proteobacterium symbiont of Bathyaustriella thionipta]|nr:NnrS family protein [gamma proteobacterium symbiont of Bathyaustriella thionipta]
MALLNLETPQKTPRFALFELGFRPFFLLAGISGFLLMLLWLLEYFSITLPSSSLNGLFWHSHEMLFAYSGAVIGGFLLTASRNWTGVQTLRATPLAVLALLWLFARILPFTGASLLTISISNQLFIGLLAAAVACPLIKARAWKNMLFIPVILLLAVCEALFMLGLSGMIEQGVWMGSRLALYTLILLVILMGGRVIPFFIEKGANLSTRPLPAKLDQATAISFSLFALCDVFWHSFSALLVVLLLLAAVTQAARLYGWYSQAIWRIPMLWILYLGYSWIFIALLIKAASLMNPALEILAVHALTAGTLGMVTLGMMSRVALGHSGRMISHNPVILSSFIAMSLAAAVRVLLPLAIPGLHQRAIEISGGLWMLAFVLFLYHFIPVLLKPRVDGRPG